MIQGRPSSRRLAQTFNPKTESRTANSPGIAQHDFTPVVCIPGDTCAPGEGSVDAAGAGAGQGSVDAAGAGGGEGSVDAAGAGGQGSVDGCQ